ncbi:hypothetical protein P3T76_000167 [Phytophthora citrophthora]|uniref:Uncharacterized protein n=1 Tax=Phytophthora citrophthora TaxID=4793 RepID=A0AAD9GZT2_9STRA|nr:hypothetical protein P3T76_000167 [Phytophthora citrophthora]
MQCRRVTPLHPPPPNRGYAVSTTTDITALSRPVTGNFPIKEVSQRECACALAQRAHSPIWLCEHAAPRVPHLLVPPPQRPSASSSEPSALSTLSVKEYFAAYRLRYGAKLMRSPAASDSGGSSFDEYKTASPMRDIRRSPTEEGEVEVDYEESVQGDAPGSPAHESARTTRGYERSSPRDPRRYTLPRQLHQPNPFPEGPSSLVLNALRSAPPLPARDEPEPLGGIEGAITNPLDEAQEASMSGAPGSRRPVPRNIVGTSSRRDYGFEPRDPAEQVKQLMAQPNLHGYAIGAAPRTVAETQQRQGLHERFLTPQVCTLVEYRQRLDKQRRRESVPQMRTYPLLLQTGENSRDYMVHVATWAEASRKLASFDRLMESYSEVDVRLARGLLFQYAKVRVRPGRFPRHTTAVALAPQATIPASQDALPVSEGDSLAVPATDQSLSSAASPSASHTSGEKRVSTEWSTSSPPGASDPRDQKRPRRQGSPASGAPQTPTSFGNEDTLATSPDTGYDHGGDDAPSGVPRGNGESPARRATAEEADSLRGAILDECDERYLTQRAWRTWRAFGIRMPVSLTTWRRSKAGWLGWRGLRP